MIQIDLNDEDIKALRYERYHHPHPRVQRKMEALLLKSQGLSHRQICKITGISANTFRRYLRAYIEGGIPKSSILRNCWISNCCIYLHTHPI